MTNSPETPDTTQPATDQTSEAPFAILISKDLFFVSRITGTASGFGWKVASDSPANAATRSHDSNCRGVLIDLTTPGLNITSLMESIGNVTSIAFGPHVQVKRLEDAKAAGCTVVLPRSRFDSTLNDLLASLFDIRSEA